RDFRSLACSWRRFIFPVNTSPSGASGIFFERRSSKGKYSILCARLYLICLHFDWSTSQRTKRFICGTPHFHVPSLLTTADVLPTGRTLPVKHCGGLSQH